MTIKRKVKRVVDGDTFEVFKAVRDSHFIRLAGVNAPEKYQKGGIEATNKLRRLIEGKTVTLVPTGRSYGRLVSDVKSSGKKVNKL
ncbi:MAG: thermonuclease family protein [archaeon]|nr:thermonuclease family protein [archaeon]